MTIGGVTAYECQIEGCDREANEDALVWSQQNERNRIAVCRPCAVAINLGEKSGKNALW